jgi:hypothetical protein
VVPSPGEPRHLDRRDLAARGWGSSGSAPWTGLGEGWHNGHHAYLALARHGVDRGQIDSSSVLIRGFERLGWAIAVQWPSPSRLAAYRVRWRYGGARSTGGSKLSAGKGADMTEKSPRKPSAKKPGKSLKEKRREKKGKVETRKGLNL